MIHVDIWGPTSVTSLHGQKFFLTIIDDFSGYTWVHLMKNKGETKPVLSKFVTLIKNSLIEKLKSSDMKTIKNLLGKNFMILRALCIKQVVLKRLSKMPLLKESISIFLM